MLARAFNGMLASGHAVTVHRYRPPGRSPPGLRAVRVPRFRRGSVVAPRRLQDDSFALGDCLAAEPKCGLEALESELIGVERPAKLVECRSPVVEHLLSRSLQQDQVSRAPEAMGEAHVPFPLQSVETLERHNDVLPRLQPHENRAGEEFAGTCLDLAFRDPTG